MDQDILLVPGYDQDGNPVDYTDEKGTRYIYEGKINGYDHWSGIPCED